MRNDLAELSDLEREFELETEAASGDDFEMEFESVTENSEYELEQDLEQDFELERDDDLEVSFERDDGQLGLDGFGASREQEYVERFLEISSRQFETSYEADEALGEVLDDIEREYFFGAIKRGLKKLSKNKLLKSLAQKGLTMGVNKFFPGLKGALQLARGNVKGALLNFGKQALGSVVPGGGAMIDAVQSIGLAPKEQEIEDRETWENYVTFAREAYEHLAENLTPKADQPAEATRLASNAVQFAIARAQARTRSGAGVAGDRRGRGRVLRLKVSPGERVKLIIVGA